MQRVLVLDRNREPLMPCHPARARQLLREGKAAVIRRYPFTIILKERAGGAVQPVAFKVDPGSKTTGIALVADCKRGKRVVWAGELTHRGQQIKDALLSRRQLRHGRRSRKTRYRPARFLNRRKLDGWLPPSLMSRVNNILTWANRLYHWSPVCRVSMELVRFDMQALENPEISGVEYQQGELLGYEVREYLLEKWGRKCAYCGIQHVPLEVEHITPKTRGGTNRVSNLTLACHDCNQKKGAMTAKEFGYPDIQAKAKRPLKDAAAVNASRWALYRVFADSGLPLEVGTGGRTKYNRAHQGYPKTHWLDAVCVGESGENVYAPPGLAPLLIKATGRQSRQMCANDKYGFPRARAKSARIHYGFQTGDIVRADIPKGKFAGRHVGRVVVRASGGFSVRTKDDLVRANYRTCQPLHKADGYSYDSVDSTSVR